MRTAKVYLVVGKSRRKLPGWEFIEILKLREIARKRKLKPHERTTLKHLEGAIERARKKFDRPGIIRCTCKGKFKIPSKDCPIHCVVG